jgi:hypothetical protein
VCIQPSDLDNLFFGNFFNEGFISEAATNLSFLGTSEEASKDTFSKFYKKRLDFVFYL